MAVRAYASGTRTRVSLIKLESEEERKKKNKKLGVLLKQSTGRMALV